MGKMKEDPAPPGHCFDEQIWITLLVYVARSERNPEIKTKRQLENYFEMIRHIGYNIEHGGGVGIDLICAYAKSAGLDAEKIRMRFYLLAG